MVADKSIVIRFSFDWVASLNVAGGLTSLRSAYTPATTPMPHCLWRCCLKQIHSLQFRQTLLETYLSLFVVEWAVPSSSSINCLVDLGHDVWFFIEHLNLSKSVIKRLNSHMIYRFMLKINSGLLKLFLFFGNGWIYRLCNFYVSLIECFRSLAT